MMWPITFFCQFISFLIDCIILNVYVCIYIYKIETNLLFENNSKYNKNKYDILLYGNIYIYI